MDIFQRREALKNMILERLEVPIAELNGMFDVSGVTLRNDLIYLERMGICKRSFGKVTACINHTFLNMNDGTIKNLEEKERIGKYAATLIEPGDSVLFYVGSTTLQVARFIDPELEFVAVTNSIYIATELTKLKRAQVVMLGGVLHPKLMATFGIQTIQEIRNFHVNKLFISTDGVDAQRGITNVMPFESEINHAVMDCAEKVILLADHTKLGKSSLVHIGDIQKASQLITDGAADPALVQQIRDAGVPVKVV